MPPPELNPALSPEQRKASLKSYPPVPAVCVVTGGTGFVGIRLVEMLVERGAKRVVAFDIVPRERLQGVWNHPAIEYVVGNITDAAAVSAAIKGADCVWHLAAAVGPFHPAGLYHKVNYGGTVNVINACREHGVKKLVFSSSPSTRFRGSLWTIPNVDGVTEDEMPKLPLRKYMQKYAETKAEGELAVTAATLAPGSTLLAVSVAPHQVYGPRDNLFMPNVMEAAGTGLLRIFGPGTNRICFTHVDNYCHALIIAERKLFPGSPVLGKFYIATDGATHPEPAAYCIFWKEVNKAAVRLGFKDLEKKFHLPFALLYAIALVCNFVGWITGRTFKLNVFNVFVLTMHRWFKIDAIENDLEYRPIISFVPGWDDTIEWFRQNWLPGFIASQRRRPGWFGLSSGSEMKINVQSEAVLGEGKSKTA